MPKKTPSVSVTITRSANGVYSLHESDQGTEMSLYMFYKCCRVTNDNESVQNILEGKYIKQQVRK